MIVSGDGERLGFKGIKLSLPVVTIVKDYSYLKYYADYVLAFREKALKNDSNLDPKSFYVPLAIIVSDDTHDKIMELLK